MQSRIQKVIGVGVGVAAVAATVGTGTAAFADPVNPSVVAVAGVGSNTTEYFMDKVAINYNAVKAHTSKLGSWDATGSATINPKPSQANCTSITRPNGSSAGITALLADQNGCINFARSSRAKKTDGSENSLAFFQFAKDNVTWSKTSDSVVPNGTKLTVAQLAAIYQCLPTAATWNQVVPGAPADPIKPYLPQDGSGTRSFFLTALGGGTAITPGACVNSNVEENNGAGVVASAGALAKDVIYPYSSGDWVAQQNKAGGQADVRDGMTIQSSVILEGTKSFTAVKLLFGSKTKFQTNPTFAPDFTRNLYNVVKLSGGTVPAAMTALFGKTGYICKSEGAVIKNFGFSPEPYGKCGLQS